MPSFYRNMVYIAGIFLLALLMHYLRHAALSLHDLLSLGALYAMGIAGAVLGHSLVPQSK